MTFPGFGNVFIQESDQDFTFDSAKDWHRELEKLFEIYFANITPMFEINDHGNIRYINYPEDYFVFLTDFISIPKNQNKDLFDTFLLRYHKHHTFSEEVLEFIRNMGQNMDLSIVYTRSYDLEGNNKINYSLKSGLMNEGCKRRFEWLQWRHHIIESELYKNSLNIADYKKYERAIRCENVSELASIALPSIDVTSEKELNNLYVLEQELLKTIATAYINSIIEKVETPETSEFKKELRERVQRKNGEYTQYFNEAIKSIYLNSYDMKNNRDEYLSKLVNDICEGAAIEYIQNKISYLDIDIYNLGLNYEFIKSRYINIDKLEESYMRNAFVVIIADRLLNLLKVTPGELLSFKGNETIERNILNTWNGLHEETMIDTDFLVKIFTSADTIQTYKSNINEYVISKSGGPNRLILEPPLIKRFLDDAMALIHIHLNPTSTPIRPSALKLQMNVLQDPQEIEIGTGDFFDYFFIPGVELTRFDRDFPFTNYPSKTNLPDSFRRDIRYKYPRILSLLESWTRSDIRINPVDRYSNHYRYITNAIRELAITKLYPDGNPNHATALRKYIEIIDNLLANVRYSEMFPNTDRSREGVDFALKELAKISFGTKVDRKITLWRGLSGMDNDPYRTICTSPGNNFIGFYRHSACSQSKDVSCGSFSEGDNSLLLKIIIPKGARILNINPLSKRALKELEVFVPPLTIFEREVIGTKDCRFTSCPRTIKLTVKHQFNFDLGRWEPLLPDSMPPINWI